jgi:hypothetical protein
MQSDPQIIESITWFDRQLECPVCFGPHNDEIHDASLSIRSWFRADIMRRMERPDDMAGFPV